MAALAGTLLRTAAGRVVAPAATGAGAAAGVGIAVDGAREARKRQEAADKARNTPLARIDAQSQAKAKDCTKEERCKECPPDRGLIKERNTNGWSELTIAYQARIGGMAVRPGFIQEWNFNGVEFDGFDSSQCMLKEAKARYDQFFNMWGQVREFWKDGAQEVIGEAMRQGIAAAPRPPTRLRWHFMESLSYRYFSLIIQAAHPDVEVVFQP